MVTDVTIRVTQHTRSTTDGDRGPTDRQDPTHQSRSARARRPATRSALRAVQHLPHPRLSLQSRPAPTPRPIPPTQLQPPRTKAAPRTSAPNTSTRSPPRSPTTTSCATSSTNGSTPPSNWTASDAAHPDSGHGRKPNAGAPSLQTDTSHPASPLKPLQYRAFRPLDAHLPQSYAWLRTSATCPAVSRTNKTDSRNAVIAMIAPATTSTLRAPNCPASRPLSPAASATAP